MTVLAWAAENPADRSAMPQQRATGAIVPCPADSRGLGAFVGSSLSLKWELVLQDKGRNSDTSLRRICGN